MCLCKDRRRKRREIIPEKNTIHYSPKLPPHPLTPHAIWATFSRREYVGISHCLKLSENDILIVDIGCRSFSDGEIGTQKLCQFTLTLD